MRIRPNTSVKPLATRKYNDASVSELSSVVKNSLSLSSIAQIANTTIGPPSSSQAAHCARVTWLQRHAARPQARSAAMSGCLANTPSFITASRRFGSRRIARLAIGSPSTSSRSAR